MGMGMGMGSNTYTDMSNNMAHAVCIGYSLLYLEQK